MHRRFPLFVPLIVLLSTLVWTSTGVHAQDGPAYRALPESEIWVEGTSNKSDWKAEATDLQVVVDMGSETSVPEVHAARMTVPSSELASGKSTIMDRLMHEALKVDEHPEIVYELTGVEPAEVPEASEAAFALDTEGRLTIAGETREVRFPVEGEMRDGGRVRFSGQYTLLMSDYGMRPPTAMFGALRTGDEVTVHFDVIVEPEP